MINGGCIVLGGFLLGDDEGTASLGDEGIGQILDWCGDIGCGGCRERRCLQRKKGYGGFVSSACPEGLRCAVNLLGCDGCGGRVGAGEVLAAPASVHQKN